MTTERMTELDKALASLGFTHDVSEARHELEMLREQLRLANDKMAEQVRQARWEVADEALDDCDTLEHFIMRMRAVKDANAPKD